jgi:hypothetical protein
MAPTSAAHASLQIYIDSEPYTTNDKDQEAASLLRLAGRDPKVYDLFLIKKDCVEDHIHDKQIVDLEDGAHFVTRRHVHFLIDGEPFETYDDTQTAAALLRLAGLDPADYDLARVSAGVSFPDDEIVTIQEDDDFVSARHVGGVA